MFPAGLPYTELSAPLTTYYFGAVWIVCTIPPSIYISLYYVHIFFLFFSMLSFLLNYYYTI
jgi:hypothetical protein